MDAVNEAVLVGKETAFKEADTAHKVISALELQTEVHRRQRALAEVVTSVRVMGCGKGVTGRVKNC